MSERMANSLPYEHLKVDDKLSLQQLAVQEAATLYKLIDKNRDHIGRWLPWVKKTNSPEDTTIFIERILENRKNGSVYGFGIILEDEIVGHISLMHLKDGREPEIGYWISSEASGKGITTKAVAALTTFGVQTLGLNSLVIRADPLNAASNRVAEKAGYTFDENYNNVEGRPTNLWIYSSF